MVFDNSTLYQPLKTSIRALISIKKDSKLNSLIIRKKLKDVQQEANVQFHGVVLNPTSIVE